MQISSTMQNLPSDLGMRPALDATVAILAPGGYAPDESAFHRGLETLRSLGCTVTCRYDPATKYQRFGADDASRLAQLHDVLNDASVDIVMALRGGYGMSRLLGKIDWPALAASGKRFVGHSDFTALQLGLLAQTGASSFAGPMLCDDFTTVETSAFMLDSFVQCMTTPVHRVAFSALDNSSIDVSGVLWGGNLAMLTHLVGTPYCPDPDGGILFVEDVNEHPYRVERMLLQLLHAGLLHRQRALILGDFSNYRLSDYDNGYDFSTMLEYLRNTLPLPVVTGLPFGHIRDKVTLPVGSMARLMGDSNAMTLEMTQYPCSSR